jgi:DnaK suppressor protein
VDADRARELLAAERRRIEDALKSRRREDDGEPNDYLDSANLASDLYQDELEEGVADDLRASLAAVERAEKRLADGTYGLSVESGEPIPDERLEALPTAERSYKRSGSSADSFVSQRAGAQCEARPATSQSPPCTPASYALSRKLSRAARGDSAVRTSS